VLDFACLERRLAIEIDGTSHDRGDRPERDERRDTFLCSRGFVVLRPHASYVLQDLAGAIAAIVAACDEREALHHQPAAGDPPPRSGEVRRIM
jgi:very-short-patch-repair endonuclease